MRLDYISVHKKLAMVQELFKDNVFFNNAVIELGFDISSIMFKLDILRGIFSVINPKPKKITEDVIGDTLFSFALANNIIKKNSAFFSTEFISSWKSFDEIKKEIENEG